LADHKCTVVSVAFSPDGRLLATGGHQDHEIHVWDVATGKTLCVPEGLQGAALALAFSPDGTSIACSDAGGGVRLYDLQTGKEKTALKENAEHSSFVTFSRDGRFLASAGQITKDGKRTWEVRLWNVETRNLLFSLPNTSDSMAFSPDDRTLSVLIPGEGVKLVNFASKADVKDTVKRFAGTWVTVSAETNGNQAPKDGLVGITMTFEDNKFALKHTDSRRVIEGTFTIDSAKTPKEYDASAVLAGKKYSITGIYEFVGDKLTICYTPDGGKRPRDFSTKNGTDDHPIYLTVYQRQEDTKGQ
jgi:uncharacterized protein (TIGR03067 family)